MKSYEFIVEKETGGYMFVENENASLNYAATLC